MKIALELRIGRTLRNCLTLIALPVAAVAQTSSPRCVYGSWATPTRFRGDSTPRLGDIDVTTSRGSTYVVGAVPLYFRSAPIASSADSAQVSPPLRVFTSSGQFLGAPLGLGDRVVIAPRAVVDRRGWLHVVWGEPPSAAADTMRRESHAPIRVASLWTAVWRNGAWTRPQPIPSGASDEITWYSHSFSALVYDSRTDAVELAFGGARVGLGYVTSRSGEWTPTEIATGSGPAGYVDLAVLGRRTELLYVAAGHPSSLNPAGENMLFLRRSENGGRDWTSAAVVGAPNQLPALESHLVVGSGDQLHALWLQYQASDITRTPRTLWQSTSTDGGATWGTAAPLPLVGRVVGFDAVADRCGAVHVLLREMTTDGPTMEYARFEGRRWTAITSPFPGSVAATPRLWLNTDGNPSVLYYRAPLQPEVAQFRTMITYLAIK